MRQTADTEPYPFYDEVREAGAVQWDESMQAWLVTTYDACKELERSEEVLFRHAYLDMDSETYVELEGGPRNLLFLAGDQHEAIHRLLMRLLAPARVKEWRETLIRPILADLVDRFADRGGAELADELAEKLPIRVIAATMDLPWQDDEWIDECKHEMDEIARFLEAHGAADDELTRRALAAGDRMNDRLMPAILERRAGNGEDIISRLWQEGPALLDGWDEIDMRANIRVLFFGGTDTTSHVLANAFHILMTQPEIADALRAGDEKLTAGFVEEALRLFGAVHFRPRVANEDTQLAGVRIPKDAPLLAVNLAANRDPDKYHRPGDVVLDRTAPRDHLAFHFGPRMCVGAALARAELQETVAHVVRRFPDLRLDPESEPPQFRGFLMRSYRPLHSRFTPA